jgi:hypothetical protein
MSWHDPALVARFALQFWTALVIAFSCLSS